MNRLTYWIKAKTVYNIQSPFLYELYTEVIRPRLSRKELHHTAFGRYDAFKSLVFKIQDHYGAIDVRKEETEGLSADAYMQMGDGSIVAIIDRPHRNMESERRWHELYSSDRVTLSVDIFDAGIAFTSGKLSKQHFLLR